MVANDRQRLKAIDTIAAVDTQTMALAVTDWATLRGRGTIARIALAQGCEGPWLWGPRQRAPTQFGSLPRLPGPQRDIVR